MWNKLTIVLVLAVFPSAVIGDGEAASNGVFSKIVQPFFSSHCFSCHGQKKQEADLALHTVRGQADFSLDVDRWGQILEKLATGQMPPDDQKQPSKQERTRVINWIKARLISNGHASEWDRKMLFPEYGNYVDHDQLFDGSVKAVAWSPSRLWKRSPFIFNSLVTRGIGLGKGRYNRPPAQLSKVKQPFTIEDKAGVKDFAAIMYADSATLGTMLRNAEVIVDKHIEGAIQELHEKIHGRIPDDQLPKDKRGKPIRPRLHKTSAEFRDIILSEKPPTDEQIDASIRKMFDLVIEREPQNEQLDKYRNLTRECIAKSNNGEGLRVALVAIAISPQAIYRSEIGFGSKDQHGRQMLGPADLAYAIAYALTDEKPDAILLKAARTGQFATRDDVVREVTRLWDNEAVEKARILRFFHEFFGYHNAPKVFKDVGRFGKDYRNVPERLVADLDVLVNYILKQDQDVLAELLTTERYFVAHSGNNEQELETNRKITKFYEYFKKLDWQKFPYNTPKEHAEYARSIGRMFAHPNGNVVKGWMRYLTKCDKNGVTPIPSQNRREFIVAYGLSENTFDFPVEQPFVLSKGKRAGILMHPAWLIAHSLNLDNDPVRRGKWIRERLLADTVPELPITVDARIPEALDQSLRERFVVTRQEYCWRCHQKMNPLGMPFESFDDFGRYRQVERLHAKGKTKPVDSTGILDNTGDPSLDGEVQNPIELMNRLAQSDRVRQSFVRHAFRYWMGRNEMLSDSATLIAADKAYVENGGSFRALVISLLTSDSFLYRKTIEH